MDLNEVLEDDYIFVDSLLGKERQDKSPQILNSVNTLNAYKQKELSFIMHHRIGLASLGTLVSVVVYSLNGGENLSINSLLKLQGLTNDYYHSVYNRLERLSKKGLVECRKVYRSNGNISYFYPTEKGIEGVLGLLVK